MRRVPHLVAVSGSRCPLSPPALGRVGPFAARGPGGLAGTLYYKHRPQLRASAAAQPSPAQPTASSHALWACPVLPHCAAPETQSFRRTTTARPHTPTPLHSSLSSALSSQARSQKSQKASLPSPGTASRKPQAASRRYYPKYSTGITGFTSSPATATFTASPPAQCLARPGTTITAVVVPVLTASSAFYPLSLSLSLSALLLPWPSQKTPATVPLPQPAITIITPHHARNTHSHIARTRSLFPPSTARVPLSLRRLSTPTKQIKTKSLT